MKMYIRIFHLTMIAFVAPAFSQEAEFDRAVKCQRMGGIWYKGSCVIDMNQEEKNGDSSSKSDLQESSYDVSNNGNIRSTIRPYFAIGYSYQRSGGSASETVTTNPDPYWEMDPSDGYYYPYYGPETFKDDLEYEKSTSFGIGVQSVSRDAFGFSGGLVFNPKTKYDYANEFRGKADELKRLVVEGKGLYSFGGGDSDILISPFVLFQYPLSVTYEDGNPIVSVDDFSYDMAIGYGLNLRISDQIQIEILKLKSDYSLSRKATIQGDFAVSRNGELIAIDSIEAKIDGKYSFEELFFQLVWTPFSE